MTPQELKSSILQLAVQGKLVEQRAEEGTAEELYQQIQEEKQRLIKEGKIKKEKPLPEITEDEIPFDIPESWKLVRFGEVVSFRMGKTPPRAEAEWWEDDIPWVSIADMPENGFVETTKERVSNKAFKEKFSSNISEAGTLLMSFKLTVGKVSILSIDAVHNEAIISIFPFVNIDSITRNYLFYILPFVADSGDSKNAIKGKTLNRKSLNELIVALPPLAEQKRIVAKIEELLPYVDCYEKAWSKLEEFNKRFPADMQKSVLQMAIQGKLVEQRPDEGTAEELYTQIQAEKQRLIEEGKIKKDKLLPEITEDEIPFDIPESWKWVRLGEICKSVADGDHQPPPQVTEGVPFLVISNVSDGRINFSNTRYVPNEYFSSLSSERIAEKGDILFTVTGSYGIPIKVDCDKKFCFQRHIALLKLLLDWDYMFLLLKSPVVKNQCDTMATGTAQKTVGLRTLRSIVLPLPPLAEQKRIVQKLEEILPLCEKLK